MLAFIGNLSPLEIIVIGVIAILVFGKRLPEVAGRFMYHVRRMRQSMYDLRRESGIDQEIRNVERTMRKAAWEAEARVAREIEADQDDSEQALLEVSEEPTAEARRSDAPDSPAPPTVTADENDPIDPAKGPAST